MKASKKTWTFQSYLIIGCLHITFLLYWTCLVYCGIFSIYIGFIDPAAKMLPNEISSASALLCAFLLVFGLPAYCSLRNLFFFYTFPMPGYPRPEDRCWLFVTDSEYKRFEKIYSDFYEPRFRPWRVSDDWDLNLHWSNRVTGLGTRFTLQDLTELKKKPGAAAAPTDAPTIHGLV